MKHVAAPAKVGEVEGNHVDPGQCLGELTNTLVVRPIAAPDEQSSLVEPDRVASLRRRGRHESSPDRQAGLDEVRRHHLHLTAAAFLARPQHHGAVVGDERGVVDVNRIGVERVGGSGDDYLGAGVGEHRPKRLVFLFHARRIRLRTPSVRLPCGPRARRRWAHEHAPEPCHHALTAVRIPAARGSRPLACCKAVPGSVLGRPRIFPQNTDSLCARRACFSRARGPTTRAAWTRSLAVTSIAWRLLRD